MKMPRQRCLFLALAAAASPALAATDASYAITIHAQADAAGSRIEALLVNEAIPLPATPAGTTVLAMPHVTSNVPTIAASVGELAARDDRGAVQLRYRDQGEGTAQQREWYADRAVAGTLRFSYRAAMTEALAARGAAPPIELRSEEGAFSGAGATFLLHPTSGRHDIELRWDLSALGAGAHAVSSLQDRNASDVDMEALDSSYFMAGKIGLYPQAPDATGFFSAWQGNTPFDAQKLLAWTQQLRQHYQAFFAVPATPYGVFLRRNRVNPGGGMGMYNSFIVTYDDDRGNDPEQLELTLAHEMFHTFQPHMSSQYDGETLADAWFNEGTAVFYQARLPFRYGMIDADAFLKDLNYTAARYYTNLLGNAPNSEVSTKFWQDTRIRTLPYDRGFLYFVTVDDAMRKTSGGGKSLDDLILAMLHRRQGDKPLGIADWEALLRDNLGEDAVRQLHAMLDGAAPLPASDAFGPCFERISQPMRRYELGFAPAALTESPRIVRDLIPGSAAAKAGVRNGDEITRPVGQDQLQGEQDGVLTLQLQRDGKPLTIAYKPRGETVATWQWRRKQGSAQTACSLPATAPAP
ncbi:M61 family metallopeptidase [Xanthomonas bonasiae]|uniref:M61 family metallopeptidase n=1 Tax=Xanthomonas bonasiae TaxID=2810351 RepID=UPI00177DDAC4|nr:peptidase M61 [Xanthomonas surreyensis]MBD7921779.1 peptidase M61 [Xanthomonas surreyensis]